MIGFDIWSFHCAEDSSRGLVGCDGV